MNFLKGFIDFYKFLFDIHIAFEEAFGRILSFSIFSVLCMILLDILGVISLGGK